MRLGVNWLSKKMGKNLAGLGWGIRPVWCCPDHVLISGLGSPLPVLQSLQFKEFPCPSSAHSSILAWEIPLTEDPGRLQCMELQKSQTRLSD